MPQQWQSLSVIRRSPPHYGTGRVATCRAPIEWVRTTGPKGALIPVDLPLDTSQAYPRHDGQIVTVIDQRAVHWTTCTESVERVNAARAKR